MMHELSFIVLFYFCVDVKYKLLYCITMIPDEHLFEKMSQLLTFQIPPPSWSNKIKDINHNNLCRFIGIVIEEGSTALVSEFCPKGSLREFFHNESMVIDLTFKYSIINDIISGLLYLHSSQLGFHGRLKSSNCLVNARFVVKLSDYGPHSLYEILDDEEEENENLKKRIWLAPEHMRSDSKIGSMKGDVYSFGLLLYEIITNKLPFYSSDKNDYTMPLSKYIR